MVDQAIENRLSVQHPEQELLSSPTLPMLPLYLQLLLLGR